MSSIGSDSYLLDGRDTIRPSKAGHLLVFPATSARPSFPLRQLVKGQALYVQQTPHAHTLCSLKRWE